jgi:hypothetical protein
MGNSFIPKVPPRGFITFEAAAEVLWQDQSEPDARWHIAFLQVVAGSQGRVDINKKGDIRLDWWSPDGKALTHVRADQIPGLRNSFARWCGLDVPEDSPTSASKPRRGRPRGSAIAGDDILVNAAIDLFRTNQAKSLTDAARMVSDRALGAGPDANYHRLRKKVADTYKKRAQGRNN